MILLKKIKDVNKRLHFLKNKGKLIGFVPTMGALHKGHISLVELSKKNNDVTVCSIFVNPVQFNDPGDFQKYPVAIEKDILLLEKNGVDILFLPSVNEIYPEGIKDLPHYNLGFIETISEGEFRPGHFQGVCQVMHRLLNIVVPDKLYLGQKDYQQCLVIKKLLQLTHIKTEIKICPIIRETNGLAMSSRNVRLNEEDRKKAAAIYKTLIFIKQNIQTKNFNELKKEAAEKLIRSGFDKIDYVEIADANSLELMINRDEKIKILALIAVYLNGVRLIDNMLLN
ncbi:MAG: pantoate--beta-alanine ligase [Chitinophagaceae bacterium]